MTVQSIDKRLTPEANMTTATQDKSQGAQVSAEDAFVALLHQTTQRFFNTGADATAVGTVLSQQVERIHVEVKNNKAAAKDDAKSDRDQSARDVRQPAKADKPRQTQSNSQAKKAAAKDDDQAAQAGQAADDSQAVATADDSQPATQAKDDKAQDKGQDDSKAQAQQIDTNTIAQQQEEVVEIDIEITETVQIIQTTGPAQTQTVDPTAQLTGKAQAAQADTKAARDPLAGLSADDKQRIADLSDRIMEDLDEGDAEDALDAATQLVSQLIDKASQQLAAGVHSHAHDIAKQTNAQAQAEDLAEMLAGTGAQLDIKVQTSQTDSNGQSAGSMLGDALAQIDALLQTQQAGPQTQDPNAGQQQQKAAQSAPDALALAAQATAADPSQLAPAIDDAASFSAVLAAQVEATTQTTQTQAKAEQPVVTNVAAIGATQAPEKASAPQAAQQTTRPARVPLAQQVMDQVSVQIDKAVKDGKDTVKIQLRPLDLGRIEVKLEMLGDGHVSATVTADKPETLALLQKDVKGLEKALEDAGLKTDSSATSFNLRGDQQQNANRGQNSNGQRPGAGPSLGFAQGADTDTPALAAVQAQRATRAGLRSGVDISV
jgi:hypothetical protein